MATPQGRITSANRYRVEIDGIGTISATQADVPELKANLHQHQAGNQRAPEHNPSTYEVGEFSFQHATAKGNVDVQLVEWFRLVHVEGVVIKRNVRVVVFDHTGRLALRTYELRDCLPTQFKPQQHAGKSTDTAEFSFSLQPEDFDIV
jgi:phage tail-like protein